MKKTRFFAFITVVAVVMTMLAGCAYTTEKPFAIDGMSINLTKDFTAKEIEGYTACYDSEKVSVYVVKEDFETLPAMTDFTVQKYAEAVHMQNQDMTPSELETKDGIPYYTLTIEDNGTTYIYVSTFFKAEDAFWIIQFGLKQELYPEFEEKIFEWAKSVSF